MKVKLNISSYIKFTITIDINSLESINSNISNTDTLTIKIPLLQPTYKVNIDKVVSNNRDIYLLTKIDNKNVTTNDNNNCFLNEKTSFRYSFSSFHCCRKIKTNLL